MLGVNGQTVGL